MHGSLHDRTVNDNEMAYNVDIIQQAAFEKNGLQCKHFFFSYFSFQRYDLSMCTKNMQPDLKSQVLASKSQ